jgi:hypothetical protein
MIRQCFRQRAVAALAALVFAISLSVASPARAQVAAPENCGVTFIGLHGLAESHEDSRTMNTLWDQFAVLMNGRGVPYGKIQLPHERLEPGTFMSGMLNGTFTGDTPITRGRELLDRHVRRILQECGSEVLALAGYSQGAWIVNDWARNTEPAFLRQVAVVVFLGDPQWERRTEEGTEEGIARRIRAGSLSYALHPPIAPSIVDRTWTWCNYNDPICGYGYAGRHEATRQIKDAMAIKPDRCGPHCEYAPSVTQSAAEVILSRVPQGVG